MVLLNFGKSGQKTIKFVHFSKSGKWYYNNYKDFKHPKISNQPILYLIYTKFSFGTSCKLVES
jgi:hypothetical protein